MRGMPLLQSNPCRAVLAPCSLCREGAEAGAAAVHRSAVCTQRMEWNGTERGMIPEQQNRERDPETL